MALRGVKVVEMIGLAPGPVCGTILADFGATVTVIHKLQPAPFDVMCNGKKMLSVNLKSKEGVEVVRKLCSSSDVLIDTYRPGVLEKIGLGPETLMKENKQLIYSRISGYGQDGYYRNNPGHDINYASISGILSMFRRGDQPPVPPMNILADFAGGSFLTALGIVIALYERTISGKGQVIDASMTEGLAYVGNWLFRARSLPFLDQEPGKNVLDGGMSFYRTYKTKDGYFMAVGSLEPQFYMNLLKGLELSEDIYHQLADQDMCNQKFEEVFLTKTQEEWIEIFDQLEACVTPVVNFNEANRNKCNASKNSFYIDHNNLVAPEPAPKLSRTPPNATGKKLPPKHGEHTIEILYGLGYNKSEIDELINKGCVYALKKSNL
ncbi:alpha-methylacyl-CoA racemase [Pieris brassicae]|uniref:alpha-methylacyl-CoA racemase n=1 Tax=Pieris brassicae TaxID=7116 RepID=UPI001E65E33C|nr:alpha-methylacyl-CoA racemase [Pieris brassicae]